jgi:rhodanese-related sulfurtransferase
MTSTITIENLRARLADGAIEQFWNVLTDQYFSGEFIPGSRRVPLDTVGRAAATLAKDAAIVVYCTSYDCPQSHLAAQKLEALGFTNVHVYAGGLVEWEQSGLPLVTTETNHQQVAS